MLPNARADILALSLLRWACCLVRDRQASPTEKMMSYHEDAISSMLGVFAALRRDHSIYHSWGLPFSDNPEMRTLRYRPRHTSLLCGFGLAILLLWNHAVPAQRQPAFPSWSLAGWQVQSISELI